MAITSQKLLPQNKSESSQIKLGSLLGPVSLGEDSDSLRGTEERVDTLLTVYTKIFNLNIQKQTTRLRNKENLRRRLKEEESEKRKQKKANLGFNIPGRGLMNKMMRFVGFTALGFLANVLSQYLPSLKSMAKFVTPILHGIGFFIKVIGGAAIRFVERGYFVYDLIRNSIKSIGGENATKLFDDFSSSLNTVLNAALIAGTLGLATGGIGTGKGKITRSAGRLPGWIRGLAGKRAPVSVGRGGAQELGQRSLRRLITTSGGKQVSERLGKKILITRAGKVLSPFFKRLPIFGALFEFGISYALGDSISKSASRAMGGLILGVLGGLIGGPVGIFLGGLIGSEVAGLLHDAIFDENLAKIKRSFIRNNKIKIETPPEMGVEEILSPDPSVKDPGIIKPNVGDYYQTRDKLGRTVWKYWDGTKWKSLLTPLFVSPNEIPRFLRNLGIEPGKLVQPPDTLINKVTNSSEKISSLQQHPSYSEGGLRIREKNTFVLQKEIVLT